MKPLKGKRIGKLVVLSEVGRFRNYVTWLCQCDCGNQKIFPSGELLRKRWKVERSCGCLANEARRQPIRHGHASYPESPEYLTWTRMRNRCHNRNHQDFHRYGGRGIKICDWWDKFENFLADMGARPAGRSLDRINNEGHYVPSNCRWATAKEQANNRRNNKCIQKL